MKTIPFLDLKLEYEYMKQDINLSIENCLKHQKWIHGPEVKMFETAMQEYLNIDHCIGVASGTDALVLSLRALAIKLTGQQYFKKTDYILTTGLSFTATADAILRAGATPVFIDINPSDYQINPKEIETFIKENPQKKCVGIIPVHLYGQASNMKVMKALTEKYNLFILEDVAQALGGECNGQKLGKIGDMGAFSFFPSKTLGAFGDAGMISTHDNELAEISRKLLKHGGKDKYFVEHIGYNSRLDTLQASILLAKLKFIEDFKTRRIKIAKTYTDRLKDLEQKGLKTPYYDSSCVFHQYTIRYPNRDKLKAFLSEKNIATMIYYPHPLYTMHVFQNRSIVAGKNNTLQECDRASKEVLSLPMEPLMKIEDIEYIISCVHEFFSKSHA